MSRSGAAALRAFAVALAVLAAHGAGAATGGDAATPGDAARLRACEQAAAAAVTGEARATLRRIPDPERRLLALRAYLRSPDLAGQWTWSGARVRAWEQSPEHARAMRELAKVQSRFAALNPGYRLHVNTAIRRLDTQVVRWNDNRSVGRAAALLAAEARPACLAGGAGAFAAWLRAANLAVPANLAAPGLSPHGRGRAFDFQVFRGGQLVAGTDSRRIQADWRDAGWAARLAEAIEASDAFRGPLQAPDEPWHYAFGE